MMDTWPPVVHSGAVQTVPFAHPAPRRRGPLALLIAVPVLLLGVLGLVAVTAKPSVPPTRTERIADRCGVDADSLTAQPYLGNDGGGEIRYYSSSEAPGLIAAWVNGDSVGWIHCADER